MDESLHHRPNDRRKQTPAQALVKFKQACTSHE
jgi:hypothetical protein